MLNNTVDAQHLHAFINDSEKRNLDPLRILFNGSFTLGHFSAIILKKNFIDIPIETIDEENRKYLNKALAE